MKIYLQACETGGSIYGKKRSRANRRKGCNNKRAGKGDLMNAYDSFYKGQAVAMRKIFSRNRNN